MKSKSWLAASCLLMMMMACADAALLVGGTRVIFDQQHAQATVQISNSGQRPLLAQMWIDRGDEGARLDEIDVPFAITPTVVRLEPGKGQTVRVLQIANGMPADRESLFWFNALEVPPRAEQAHGGQIMEFALRTRMKLFYRPEGLRMTPAQAYERLHFRIEPHALPSELAVRVNNPSPYFMTLSSLVLRASGAPPVPVASLRRQQERMIAPWSDAVLILDLLSASRPDLRSLELVYSVVNDHGGESRGERIDVSLGLP